VEDLDLSKSNLIAHKVEINLNMLRALVLNGIAGHVDRLDVVAEDYCSAAKRGMKLHQELAKPGSLGYSIGDCTILCFCTGAGDRRLALGGPGDEIGAEEHRITRSGFASLEAASPVSIGVDNQVLHTGRTQV
jgi:hypothetical protein